MEAFLRSLLLVALGEIGDKTQLLSFALASRYRTHWPILAGVVLATLINHGLSAWLGVWLTHLVPLLWLKWFLAASFIALGLWMLIPDREEELENGRKWGPFVASFVLFFLAEIGDKTQLATIALGARYPDQFASVLSGTTLGMVAANVPVILLGAKLTHPRWETWAHRLSALLFIGVGVATLVTA